MHREGKRKRILQSKLFQKCSTYQSLLHANVSYSSLRRGKNNHIFQICISTIYHLPSCFFILILWDSIMWKTQGIDSFPHLYYHLASTLSPFCHFVGPAFFGTSTGKLSLLTGVCYPSWFAEHCEDLLYDTFSPSI